MQRKNEPSDLMCKGFFRTNRRGRGSVTFSILIPTARAISFVNFIEQQSLSDNQNTKASIGDGALWFLRSICCRRDYDGCGGKIDCSCLLV
jgi:hypothetical protein